MFVFLWTSRNTSTAYFLQMAKIDYGTVEYFTLLDLSDRLKAWKYDKLDLLNLDKLRLEVEQKIAAIQLEAKEKKG